MSFSGKIKAPLPAFSTMLQSTPTRARAPKKIVRAVAQVCEQITILSNSVEVLFHVGEATSYTRRASNQDASRADARNELTAGVRLGNALAPRPRRLTKPLQRALFYSGVKHGRELHERGCEDGHKSRCAT